MERYIVTIEKVVEVQDEKYPRSSKIFEQTLNLEDDSLVSKIALLINGNLKA